MSCNHISDFDYVLPEQLIAQYPLLERTASRLLLLDVDQQSIQHQKFTNIADILQPNDLLVLNNTKVFPARLYGKKSTGGRIECLIERVVSEKRAFVHLKSSKSPKLGSRLIFSEKLQATMIEREDDLFLLEFDCKNLFDILEVQGHIPLPPYINRHDSDQDKARYQTVYAKHRGAVAAPTAGLHFTSELIDAIEARGVLITQVTLHVGAGTFQPVRVDCLDQHKMHREYLEVSEETCNAITAAQKKGGRIVAVGTTTLRALETAARSGGIKPFQGYTDLFIRPGYSFQCVDALVTNFHLPKSTLLMLVSAFGGYEFIKRVYQEAIQKKYRFFSYGDAMFIQR